MFECFVLILYFLRYLWVIFFMFVFYFVVLFGLFVNLFGLSITGTMCFFELEMFMMRVFWRYGYLICICLFMRFGVMFFVLIFVKFLIKFMFTSLIWMMSDFFFDAFLNILMFVVFKDFDMGSVWIVGKLFGLFKLSVVFGNMEFLLLKYFILFGNSFGGMRMVILFFVGNKFVKDFGKVFCMFFVFEGVWLKYIRLLGIFCVIWLVVSCDGFMEVIVVFKRSAFKKGNSTTFF